MENARPDQALGSQADTSIIRVPADELNRAAAEAGAPVHTDKSHPAAPAEI
jgi:FKBP-type peptidyl-prolyl cis-trans isomerase 2